MTKNGSFSNRESVQKVLNGEKKWKLGILLYNKCIN